MQLLFLLAQTVTDFADASHSRSAKSIATIVLYGIFSSENSCLCPVTICCLHHFSQLLENPSVFSRSFLNVSTSAESSAIRASVMRLTGAEMLRA